jgi:hypothetical protein
MSNTSYAVYDYPEPPPGWADEEYPTLESQEDWFMELADRLWDEDHDF